MTMVTNQNWRENDLNVEDALEITGIILSRLLETALFWRIDFAAELL